MDNPSTPLITQIKGLELGGYKVAYLRGNHLTLEPDENFSDEDFRFKQADYPTAEVVDLR